MQLQITSCGNKGIMLYKIKGQVSDNLYKTICLMAKALGNVYRFSGKYTRVSRPNSVQDHILSLYTLIDEVFAGMPPEYDFIRTDMYMRATLHDAGEILGELNVLEYQVQSKGLSKEDKKECEQIIFEYFLTQAYKCVLHGENENAFMSLIKRVKDSINQCTRATGDFKRAVHALKASSYLYDMVPEIADTKKYYEHIENDISYAGKLFKALDLIDGNEYYINNAENPEKVPQELHTRVEGYCKKIMTELRTAEKHNAKTYDDLTDKVVKRMQDNIDRYNALVV